MSTQSTLLGSSEAIGTADAGKLLGILENETARSILGSMGDRSVTAGELAERCPVPPSTMYRQLGELTDVGLVRTSVRIAPSGHHATEYSRAVSDITISLGRDDGVRVDVD